MPANKHDRADLINYQMMPLSAKIDMSKVRIMDWINTYGTDGVYVSFSGGIDSTVLLDLVREDYPEVEAMFIDTGLEFPEIRDFVKSFNNVTWLHPIVWNNKTKCYNRTNFREVIKNYGYPIISKEQASFIQEYRDTKSDKLKQTRWNGNSYGKGKICERYKYLVEAPFKISDKCCDILKKNPVK